MLDEGKSLTEEGCCGSHSVAARPGTLMVLCMIVHVCFVNKESCPLCHRADLFLWNGAIKTPFQLLVSQHRIAASGSTYSAYILL